MKEILVDGNIKYKETCPNCKCIYTYENDDIKISNIYTSDKKLLKKTFTHICPFCNTDFITNSLTKLID